VVVVVELSSVFGFGGAGSNIEMYETWWWDSMQAIREFIG